MKNYFYSKWKDWLDTHLKKKNYEYTFKHNTFNFYTNGDITVVYFTVHPYITRYFFIDERFREIIDIYNSEFTFIVDEKKRFKKELKRIEKNYYGF